MQHKNTHPHKKPEQQQPMAGPPPAVERPLDTALLDLYSDYLIASVSATTATGLSNALDNAVSHDRITRFLSTREYTAKDWWKLAKPTIRQIETDAGVLVLDDTIEEKLYTDENDIIAWHYDHVFHRAVKGLNILNCLYHTDQGTVLTGMEIVKKDERYIDTKTKKEKRRSKKTKNELARELVGAAVSNNIRFTYCLADSWFSSQENMEFVVNKGKHFIFALKSNRTIALTKEDKYKGKFQAVDTLTWEEGTAKTGYLKGMNMLVKLTRQVFTNKDGSSGILYLATSDLTLEHTDIVTIYQKRWKVEEYHKSIKSNLGLAKSPTKTTKTQTNHCFAVAYAWHKLEQLSHTTTLNHFALKAKLYLKAMQASMVELRVMQGVGA